VGARKDRLDECTGLPSRKKQIPEFRSEEAERNFWAQHDSTEYIDWESGRRFLAERLEKERKRA
jgi:hypothetical protein